MQTPPLIISESFVEFTRVRFPDPGKKKEKKNKQKALG